jgi:hypothetical protein
MSIITRPYDFGTDAIERQRVSIGQSLIDADFEYGTQATKWQTYSDYRKFPSFYEIPGSDVVVSSVVSDGASPRSNMTVTYVPDATLTGVSGGAGGTTTSSQLTSLTLTTRKISPGMYVFFSTTFATGPVIVKSVDSSTTFTVQYSSQTVVALSNATATFLIWLPAAPTSIPVITLTNNVSCSASTLTTSTQFTTTGTTTGITAGMYVTFKPAWTGVDLAATVKSVDSSTTFTVQYPQKSPGAFTNGTAVFSSNTWSQISESVINVNGLSNRLGEGFTIITGVNTSPSTNQFTYKSTNTVTAGSVYTSSTSIRRGAIYNNTIGKIAGVGNYTNDVINFFTPLDGQNYALPSNTALYIWCPVQPELTGVGFVKFVSGTQFPEITVGSLRVSTSVSTIPMIMYILPYAYTIHRPLDGGVLISPNIPTSGASIVRQSKKVFRYQSGKGLLWSSGTLFCPSFDITEIIYNPGSGLIYPSTAVPHGLQVPTVAGNLGATVQIKGITTSGYNGTYRVASISGDSQIRISSYQVPGSSNGVLSDKARLVVTNWHGSSVRAGCFDDQNGLFWEYDGQTLWVVKRSSTFQLAGFVYISVNTTTLNGTGTRFKEQLKLYDRITIRGMTYQVTSIVSDTVMTVIPPYRGSTTITSSLSVKACKIIESRVPQNQFNRDTIDGKGSSGYNVDLTRMQMIGLQYSWYGAGFIDFMIRGSDGNWIYVHRFKNNNVNDEAYMRSGNTPVRYEVINETLASSTTLTSDIGINPPGGNLITLSVAVAATTYLPNSGIIQVDSEYMEYSSKTPTTLNVVWRRPFIGYKISNFDYANNGGSVTTHAIGAPVILISCTCSPSLTHWGSAFIMDGNFDTDRGYFFNYQVNSATTLLENSTQPLFMLRLAPSVSNGVVGDMGTRDLLNRAQLLLQRLDIFCGSSAGSGSTGSVVVNGVLNPSFVNPSTWSWTAINSLSQGSQPSFAQVATNFGTSTYIVGSGERVFTTICNNGQNSIDLTNLKEVCNGVMGGNGMFPNGPDTLLVYLKVPNDFPSLLSYSVNLFWTEAQA